MTFQEYKFLVYSDLYRITGAARFSSLVRNVLFGGAFQFIFWMRTCRYLRGKRLFKFTLYPFALLCYNHCMYKFGIGIPFITEIGSGFFIGHFGGIFVYPDCRIGKNCNLSQGVTLGKTSRGERAGYPILGDNVYVGPGAKIIGSVRVGNNAAIGANCVVTRDVPDHAVVVGIPGKVISHDGSEGYINHTDYEEKLRNVLRQ